MQTVGTDQQVAFDHAAVFEIDRHAVGHRDDPTARELHRMRSVGKSASSRSSRTRRGTIRTGAPSRLAIVVTSKVATR